MRKRLIAVCALTALAAVSAQAAGGLAWTEDAAKAMATAAREGKDLLINFTGSDWCGWCIRLDKEVFAQAAFVAEAPKSFVFLKLDFPRQRPMPEAVKKQNAEWQARFRITGYPTIILADASGKPYARTGYQAGGPEKYLESLAALRKVRTTRDEAFEKAKAAEGIEKAKLLDAALSGIEAQLVLGNYADVMAEIVKLDPANEAGLKNKYGALAALPAIEAAANGKNPDEALALADDALKTYGATGSVAQDILFLKSLVLYRKGDKAGAKAGLEAALAAAPAGPKAQQIKAILDRAFKDVK